MVDIKTGNSFQLYKGVTLCPQKGESGIKNILEREVEGYLVRRLAELGLACHKFIPDQRNGMPDRIIPLPDQKVVWVETKRPRGGKLSELQKLRHKELRTQGHVVVVVWTKEDADTLVDRLRGELSV